MALSVQPEVHNQPIAVFRTRLPFFLLQVIGALFYGCFVLVVVPQWLVRDITAVLEGRADVGTYGMILKFVIVLCAIPFWLWLVFRLRPTRVFLYPDGI
jgi:hypothetical protein